MNSKTTSQRIIHICSPGSPAGEELPELGVRTWDDLVRAVREAVGPAWRVAGDPGLIWARQRLSRGGRDDDARRAADLTAAMADDRVRAIVPLRGGAWLLRILDRIDFSVLAGRANPVWLIGFSEWTCMMAAAARWPQAVCVHHTSPHYMLATRLGECLSARQKRRRWRAIWASIAGILAAGTRRQGPAAWAAGRGASGDGRRTTGPVLRGRLVQGRVQNQTVRLVGGNLTLLAALAGTKFHEAASARGSWLAIEDVNESIGRIDRKLAQLRLAGLLDGVAGVLLGRFDHEGKNLSRAVAEVVRVHVGRAVPIVVGCNFGHCWPAAPWPLGRFVRVASPGRALVQVRVDWAGLGSVRSEVRGTRYEGAGPAKAASQGAAGSLACPCAGCHGQLVCPCTGGATRGRCGRVCSASVGTRPASGPAKRTTGPAGATACPERSLACCYQNPKAPRARPSGGPGSSRSPGRAARP